MNKLLSKSKYLNGLQCPKYLWTLIHCPETIPEPDTTTQHLFDQGHLVGKLAKRLFPEGIDIPTGHFEINMNLTRELLLKRKPLFEAEICIDSIYCRVDILNPVGKDNWEIIEVNYELNNRPKWVGLPLRGMLQMLETTEESATPEKKKTKE